MPVLFATYHPVCQRTVEGLELYIPGADHISDRPFQGRRGVYPLLFKPEHVGLILSGRKTQTRRVWKKSRARVGAVHKAKTALFSPDHFALIRITGLRRERLGDITQEDVRREGYDTLEEFKAVWVRINGSWDPELEVYVVSFELAGVDAL